MHAEAYDYIRREAALLNLAGKDVVEIGSYNVNGSVRPLFAGAASYTGIDVRPGPGVDLVLDVCDGGTWDDHPAADIVVTTETLEHASDPLVLAMRRRTSADLVLFSVLTCASAERAPHGCDGGPVVPPHENYQRISAQDLAAWLCDFQDLSIDHFPMIGDLYARAVKRQDA